MGSTFISRLDKTTLIVITFFSIFSIGFIYSSQETGQYIENFALMQARNYFIGVALLIAVAYLDADQIERIAWPLYIIGFLAIVLLPLMPSSIAPIRYGAQRWYSFPIIGSIQPSEFFKIALIVLAARITTIHNALYEVRTVWTDIMLIGKILLITLIPSFFIYQQPDTGMVFIYLAGSLAVIFLSGVKKKLLVTVTAIPILIFSVLLYLYFLQPAILFDQLVPLLKPHQQERILGWLMPYEYADHSYQTTKSLLAVGSGELLGKGIGKGMVYIPEKHTDFIFATIAEEGGFVTASFVVSLLFIFLYRMVIIGGKSESPFGLYVCVGAMAMYTLQIFQNIGMTIGLMPVKGISLPFLSYGGSSLFSNMILAGLILSIRKPYQKFMFKSKNSFSS